MVTFSIELKDLELVQEYFVFEPNRMPMRWIHNNNWSGGYLNEQHMPFVPLPPSLTTGSSNSIEENKVQFQGHSEIPRLLSGNENEQGNDIKDTRKINTNFQGFKILTYLKNE
ncbi:unnamed protein product [Adineta steineri]|uniref:Uncharacterized protein n=1 Tax=Adineta steineri TaxID=433720 RepID=A0A815WNU1_9BILA|nr:unnamed protein product [Adineta steineri]CAF1544254.1 unnamed protein product [Adineta steineri]